VELEEHGWRRRVIQRGVAVDRVDRRTVEQFGACNGNPLLYDLDNGAHGRGDRFERADRDRGRGGNGMQPDGQLRDDPQRALRADEEMGQVVPRGRLARAAPGADRPAVGQHDLQGQHVFSNRPVTHSVGARGTGRSHASQRRIGAGVDGEEQPAARQAFGELEPRDARLDHRVLIVDMNFLDAVHPRQIDGQPASRREAAALDGTSRPVGDDRHTRIAAPAKDP